MKPTPPPRLALLRASSAPIAVIFRRGPSKRVELIRWDLARDAFERGHWFGGRIYDKRSDLSPDGTLLIYFASKFTPKTLGDREYTYAWTAVSRPPWLTALALWPKRDCWWGGGLFLDERTVWLNHRPEEATPHPDHRPGGLSVQPNPEAHGENEPVYQRRLGRDGWKLRQEWTTEWRGIDAGYRTITPDERVKRHPLGEGNLSIVLERRIDHLRYRERFLIEGTDRTPGCHRGRWTGSTGTRAGA